MNEKYPSAQKSSIVPTFNEADGYAVSRRSFTFKSFERKRKNEVYLDQKRPQVSTKMRAIVPHEPYAQQQCRSFKLLYTCKQTLRNCLPFSLFLVKRLSSSVSFVCLPPKTCSFPFPLPPLLPFPSSHVSPPSSRFSDLLKFVSSELPPHTCMAYFDSFLITCKRPSDSNMYNLYIIP